MGVVWHTTVLEFTKAIGMKQGLEAFAAERARMSEHSIPELIELLSSANLRTRFLAEMCLRDATST